MLSSLEVLSTGSAENFLEMTDVRLRGPRFRSLRRIVDLGRVPRRPLNHRDRANLSVVRSRFTRMRSQGKLYLNEVINKTLK